MTRTANHRRDIDGLRAVAVLPVILFHAGLPAFTGGYLGVDIFFVISGFLITRLLARDLAAGRFSLARFYERRARRILPALAAVMLATLPFALAWLSPIELENLAGSYLATALSVSNIFFWQQLDYFGPDAARLPLLHTWSLGIEEQFYLLFPLLLAALWHFRRRTALAALVAMLAASLALAAWAAGHRPSAGFFLLPFRAWELLFGAQLALVPARRPSGHLAAAGLAAIAAAMAGVPLGLLPGLLPIVVAAAGTALVIAFTAPDSAAGRLLSHPVPVGIGLISYSAYLWHQPLLAFARIRFGPLDAPAVLALGAASLLLAWPTWRFVETPFRQRATIPLQRPLRTAALAIAALATIGAAGLVTDGLAGRKSPAVRAILASVTDVNPHRAACKTGIEDPNPRHPVAACLIDGTLPAVAFYGDSHADALQGALWTLAEKAGFRFYTVTRSACPPIPGLTRTGSAASPACDAFVRDVEAYVRAGGFKVVAIVARWTSGVAATPFDNREGGVEGKPGDFLIPIGAHPADDAARARAVIHRYVAGIEALLADGQRVVLIYPIPEAGWNVPEELARRREGSPVPVTLSTPLAAFADRQRDVIAAFDAIDSPDLYRVRPDAVLCDTIVRDRCANSIGDQTLYFDESHLNNAGAALIAPHIVDAIEAARRGAGPIEQAAAPTRPSVE